MQVIIKGRHTEVDDDLKELAVRKIDKVRRLFDRIQILEIEFSEEHSTHIANKHLVEVTLTTKGHLLRASAAGPDPASAVDAVVDKLQSQVTRLKDKIVRRKRRGGSENGLGRRKQETEADALEFGPESEDGQLTGARITRTTRISSEPMSPEEAVVLAESLGHQFLLFVNTESKRPAVVYRRGDGSFGLIEQR